MTPGKPHESWQTVLDSPTATPSGLTGQALQTLVYRELHPPFVLLLFKALGIHCVAASISLLACPQFGFHPLGLHFDPLAFLSAYGDAACGLGCGVAFSLLTGVAIRVFLTRDERRVAAQQGFWIFTPVMALSWALLMWAGQPQAGAHHWVASGAGESSASVIFSSLWLMGAVAAAWAGLLAGAKKTPAARLFLP